ncbi:MAG: bis(5'-nucleosyl)-tetraphosphatase (symmetrical) [Lentisphaeria bacterium]|jgi:bis(5'-nucleosyl)-tetraphosphatase (symmetrical)
MATYAVGDIQGCLDSLRSLLNLVGFSKQRDYLWVLGDLVNRGPDSLNTLRYIKELGSAAQIVLGNHDLHLLATAATNSPLRRKDTLSDILKADDRDELMTWLKSWPLVHRDSTLGYAMVHAGIPPIWNIEQALKYSNEIERVLQSEQAASFFKAMYGNEPTKWRDDLSGMPRLRLITNYFTRMRFCTAQGKLELTTKTDLVLPPKGYKAWFEHKNHRCKPEKLLFGHWASLMGETNTDNFIGLDTGCVWGGALTMMRLEDGVKFAVDCPCGE